MATFHVTLEASVPDQILATLDEESELRARSALLAHSWYERRAIDWRFQSRPIDHNGQSQTRHQVRLDLDCPRTPRPKSASLRFHFDVVTSGEDDPCDKARRILDLPGAPRRCGRSVILPGSLDRGSFARIRGNSTIGPVPGGWPVDRLLTRYAHHLGSYGQGGVGLSGWQLNGGSWLVLPLKYSDSYIWLTFENPTPTTDYFSLDVIVDHRVIGVHPDQIGDFPPWEHCYVGHPRTTDLPDFENLRPTISRFDTTASGFVLEAVNGLQRWRFAMDDHLPRPVWGSGKPRNLHEGESVADAFLLTHDCYLEV